MYEDESEPKPKTEIVFEVTEDPEGEYEACALGESIYADAKSLGALRRNVTEAVRCHFIDEFEVPSVIVLRFGDRSEQRIELGNIYPEIFGLHDLQESEAQKFFRGVNHDSMSIAVKSADSEAVRCPGSPTTGIAPIAITPTGTDLPRTYHVPPETPANLTDRKSETRVNKRSIKHPMVLLLLIIVGAILLATALIHKH